MQNILEVSSIQRLFCAYAWLMIMLFFHLHLKMNLDLIFTNSEGLSGFSEFKQALNVRFNNNFFTFLRYVARLTM